MQWHTSGVSLVESAEAGGGRLLCLGLQEKPAVDLFFPAITVVSGVKYRLSFRARLDGPDTLAENPQLEYLFSHYNKGAAGKNLPGWGGGGLRFRMWFSGDPFPVVAGCEYRLTVPLETVGKIGGLSLHLPDPALAKAVVLMQMVRQSAAGRQTHRLDFVVPAGVAWLRLVGSSGYFDRIAWQKVEPGGAE